MKTKLALVLVSILLCTNLAQTQEWQSLFDGKTLDGWRPSETSGSFRVLDGQIACAGPRSHYSFRMVRELALKWQDIWMQKG